MPPRPDTGPPLYTVTFYLALAYNFLIGMNFTNSAVLPLYVKELGGTAETVGLFMGTAAIAAVFVRPLIGLALDRIGAKPVMIAGGLMLSLAPLGYWALLGTGELGWAVYLLRAVHGFGFGAHFSAFFAMAASTSAPERRNEAIAMYGISGLAAHLVGPFLGETILESQGLPGFFAFISGFGLLGVLLLAFFLHPGRGSEGAGHAAPKPAEVWRLLATPRMRLPFMLAILLSVTYSSTQFFLAPLAKERMISDFGLYFTGYAVAGISVRLLSRTWGDRYGVRRVMVPAFLAYAVGMALVFFSSSTVWLIVAGCSSGAAHAIVFPAVNSLGYSLAPEAVRGSAVAILTGMLDAGSVMTAFLFGMIAEQFGYSIVFVLAAGAGLLASSLALTSVLRRPEVIRTSRSREPSGSQRTET